LIREMSRANGLWGAPRIHGELLKLGIEVAQSTVAKYTIKRPRRPGQSWVTFLRNHADGIAAADLFVVPTVAFTLLYVLVILGLPQKGCIEAFSEPAVGRCEEIAGRIALVLLVPELGMTDCGQ
jgi:hypothetical protein